MGVNLAKCRARKARSRPGAQKPQSQQAATSHPAFIDEIGGSLEETQPYTEGRVVWDANIITSRGPGTALEWSLCCVEAIFGRAKALEVAGPMVTQPATLPPKRPFEWRLEEEVSSRVDRSLRTYAT